MTALVSVRRRWTAVALVGGIVALVMLVVLGIVGVDTLANSKEGRPANTLPQGRALPPTPAALLAVRDDGGELTSLVVLALAPPNAGGDPRGGTIIPIPAGSAVFQGYESPRLRMVDVYADGGIDALAEQASVMLELNFSLVAEVDGEGLAALLEPLGAVTVDMPGDVIDSASALADDGGDTDSAVDTTTDETSDTTSDTVSDTTVGGESEPVFGENDDLGAEIIVPAGVVEVEPAQGAAVLTSFDATQPESVRFEQELAYWIGAANRVADGLLLGIGDSATASMKDFLWSVFGGPTTVYALRGVPIPTGSENPDGLDMYKLESAERMRVIATVLPDAVSPVEVVFTAEIVSPFGDPAITQAAVERLGFAGVGIILVRELPGIEVPDRTQFSLGGRVDLADVQPFADSLGETDVVALGLPGTPHGRVQGIDATFVLGQSFVDLLSRQLSATTVPPTSVAPLTTVSGADENTTIDTSGTTEASG